MTTYPMKRPDGTTVRVTIPENDRETEAILEAWPTLRAALDVLADPDADLFSAAFVRALAAVRRSLATVDEAAK